MECIKFNLSGKTAFFKKPDVNAHTYFTYNNIHKIALLGIIGSIIGLEGWKKEGEPQFYEKLKKLHVSIVPNGLNGYFSKKTQTFNNSTGLASKENGGNLIVREQWLENPNWDVYLMQNEVENYIWTKIKDYLVNGKCVYIPYLGKNDHPATIKSDNKLDIPDFSAELIEVTENKEYTNINSLFMGCIEDLKEDPTNEKNFIFTEFSPYKLNKEKYFYEYRKFIFTNNEVNQILNNIFSYNKLNLFFY